MRRHEVDLFSLIAGAVFVAVAAGHLLDEAVGINFDGHWVLPVALVAIGVAGLASLAGRDRAAVRAPAAAEAEPEAGPEPESESAEASVAGDERSEDR